MQGMGNVALRTTGRGGSGAGRSDVALNRQEIIDLYRRRARHYDFTANLYYLIGFREQAFRKKAVGAMGLRKGHTVVEVCCGTGMNFPLLQEQVGAEGRIIGVDMSEDMLRQAGERVEKHGWSNVELIRSDAAVYDFPSGVDGILSTFAITLVPEYDRVILRGCEALKPGGRWVILDLKLPSGLASKLSPLLIPLTRPFGVTEDLMERHPWESLENHMTDVSVRNLYMGYAYIAVGTRGETCA
jgi:demethylmenaquinone methyltransferase/2-methoxy-6-polyprenyl-1,4-benzoquinol methylase